MATQSMHPETTPERTEGGRRSTAADGQPVSRDERSVSGMVRELRDQMTTLVRDEVALAKAELGEKVSRLGRNGGYLGTGALVAFAGLIVLLMAASAGLYAGLVAAGLSHMTSGWLAPLIVGAVVLGIGYGLVQKAISTLRNESLVPQRTAESVREDADWMKRKVK